MTPQPPASNPAIVSAARQRANELEKASPEAVRACARLLAPAVKGLNTGSEEHEPAAARRLAQADLFGGAA
jgi:hypothetical protein